MSTSLISVVVVVLALGAYSQGQNVTLPVDDVSSNVTIAMTSSQPDINTTMDNITAQPPVVTDDTINATVSMTNSTDGADAPAITNATMPPTQPTTMESTSIMATQETITSEPCKTGTLTELSDYTDMPEFKELSSSSQVFIFEVLGAAEGCKMASFITAETALRTFRAFGELPTRYVYALINYMAMALQNEGIVGPS